MECKELSGSRQVEWQECINRNIVECKDKHGKWLELCETVLIETLWNVKQLGFVQVPGSDLKY